MKHLSRDEMKNVMGGNFAKFEWTCWVSDGSPTGGGWYNYCSFDSPADHCQDTSQCTSHGTCNYAFGCINY